MLLLFDYAYQKYWCYNKIGVNNFYCFSNKMHPIDMSASFHPAVHCGTPPKPFVPPRNEFGSSDHGRGSRIFGGVEKVCFEKEKSMVEGEKN